MTLRALVVIPDPEQPGLTPAEQLALRIRAAATISGRCACGATWTLPPDEQAGMAHVGMEHEPDCPAASPLLDTLAERMGDRLRLVTVAAEIESRI